MILFGGEVGYRFIRRNLINRCCPNTLCLILTSIFAAVNVSEPNSDSSVFVETQDFHYRTENKPIQILTDNNYAHMSE